MTNPDVEKWKKRLRRKGPYYLYEVVDFAHTQYDHSTKPSTPYEVPAKRYFVIWNDGEKTKYGGLSDYMWARYGIATTTVLKGDTHYDLWNGHCIDDEIFGAMLAVRRGESELPEFDFEVLRGLGW